MRFKFGYWPRILVSADATVIVVVVVFTVYGFSVTGLFIKMVAIAWEFKGCFFVFVFFRTKMRLLGHSPVFIFVSGLLFGGISVRDVHFAPLRQGSDCYVGS